MCDGETIGGRFQWEKRVGGYNFDLPPKATPEVITERGQLADEACRALVRAGISAYREDLDEHSGGRPGAHVRVDPLADGGVLVDWNTQAELTAAAVDLLERGVDPSHLPREIRHFETVQTCMRDAVLGILASAGFQVEKADAHSYGNAVQVKGFTH
ncbi:hypothetical protein GCM10010284_16420 [Streptomyces rubiginosohelvolus]|uniref:Uncharacterized protein n=1 Tax=Streptomyces rubiginosohelvolus TaxID=67362 RepID=A0ABQ3BKI1_9ACTN|nr:hypothetical protein GCM10010284_16420 [Streptomyces rubiginosohelvolus]GGZ48460.1 hypothetical protein GCM10010328_23920 [Streptomyces pluricolorescens]